MSEVIEILFKPINWAWDVFTTKFFGINLFQIALSLFVMNTVARFLIFPFFGGAGIKTGASDVVRKSKSRSNDNG